MIAIKVKICIMIMLQLIDINGGAILLSDIDKRCLFILYVLGMFVKSSS